MHINETQAKILNIIGKHPQLEKGEIVERLDIQESSVSHYLYKLREHQMIIKTPSKRHKDTDFNWELTGKGYRRLKRYIENKFKDFAVEISEIKTEEYHRYIPPKEE